MPSLTPIGRPFIELPEVESTNNYAMGLVREAMAQHGTAVFAHHQTKGRGQRGKHWWGNRGENIAVSMIVDASKLDASRPFLLSMCAAISTKNFFNRFIPDEVKIKWPNDIYWRDRKAAGILIENLWQHNRWNFSVIGIGINVNQSEFNLPGTRAVSMKQVTGESYNPVDLAKMLCHETDLQYQRLLAMPGQIIDDYRTHLYKLNEKVKLKIQNRVFEAEVKDVLPDGRLVVTHAIDEYFSVGEIEWIAGD